MKTFLLFGFIIFCSLAHARKVKIKIYDKISMVDHALMIKAVGKNDIVKFEWSEPYSDFSYFLQIFRTGTKSPISTMPVSGRTKSIKFKKETKKLYWRVFAKSRHGNVTKNKKRFLVPLRY